MLNVIRWNYQGIHDFRIIKMIIVTVLIKLVVGEALEIY